MIDYKTYLVNKISTLAFQILYPFLRDKSKRRELSARLQIGINAVIDDLQDGFLIETEKQKPMSWLHPDFDHIKTKIIHRN